MRIFLTLVALLAVGPFVSPDLAHAQRAKDPGEMGALAVIETAPSTATVSRIAIASHTATSVITSTGFASIGYRGVYIQNIAQNGALICGENVNLSTQTVNGIVLSSAAAHVPPLPYYFPVPATGNFYCMCNANNDATCPAIRNRVR